MSTKTKNNYWGILPASVRYDTRLSPSAKLIYSELTALTNKHGFCWASNQYFADLFVVHKKSVSRWISELVQAGHVRCEILTVSDGYQRRIYLTQRISNKATAQYARPLISDDAVSAPGSPHLNGEGIRNNVEPSPLNCGENNTTNTHIDKVQMKRARAHTDRPNEVNEVIEYFTSQELPAGSAAAEASKFWNHYESIGWKIGGHSTMKNWHAAARQWILRMDEFSKPKTSGSTDPTKFIDYKEIRKQTEYKKLMEE